MIKKIAKLKLLISFFFVFFCLSFAKAQSSGTFMVVKGDVQVKNKIGAIQKAKIGMKVIASDTISSGAEGRAKIVMSDKNIINISPDTIVELEKYIYDPAKDDKQVTLNVLQGKVRTTVEQKYDGEKNKFHVKTPSAVAGVRGTDFLTSYSPATKEMKLVTFKGQVAVGLPTSGGGISNPVLVNPGQATSAQNGAPPTKPIALPPQEVNSMNKDSDAEAPPTKATSGGTESKSDSDEKNGDKDSKSEDGKKDESQKENKKDEAKDESKEDSKENKGDSKGENKKEDSKEQKDQQSKNEDNNGDKKETKKEELKEDKKEVKKDDSKKESDNKSSTKNDNNGSGGTSSTEPKSADAKNDSTNGDRKPASQQQDNSASGGKNPQGGNPNSPPSPASTSGGPMMGSGGMMLDKRDLAPEMSNSVINNNTQIMPPPVVNFRPPVTQTEITKPPIPTEFINNTIIQNTQKATVNITIQK